MSVRSRLKLAMAGVALTALAASGCSAPEAPGAAAPPASAPGDVPDKPSAPVELHILDVAGAQRITKSAFDTFARENPDVVSAVTWESGGAPDVVGTIKPQVDSGQHSIDLVLTGIDGLSSGIGEDLWVDVVGEHGDRLSNREGYSEGAQKAAELGQGRGVLLTYTPGGPLLQYNPADIPADQAPSTPQEVLEWAKAHPGRFGYARPANSGPGRTWLQGLPYLLGDADPKDPVNGWDKTWAYLEELGQYVENYPTGTGQVITNMADNTWSLTPMTLGWDIEPRAAGRAPAGLEVTQLENSTWIADAHYAAVPKGLSADKVSAILLVLQDALTPEQNAKAYENGYLYPGPAIEDATLDKAPQAAQDLVAKFGRDWYDDAIASRPVETQLSPEALVAAFDTWDRQVGAGKFEKK